MSSIVSTIHRGSWCVSLAMLGSLADVGGVIPGVEAQATPRVEADGTIHVPAFDLPESSLLSQETRAALKQWRDVYRPDIYKRWQPCPPTNSLDKAAMPSIRKCQADAFYTTAFYKSVRERYAVAMTPDTIGGVYTEVFTPTAGVASTNEQRVLINVHGGAFQFGSRTNSHLESIPIAAVGKVKVISIDYRMAPEYTFPAASEDVAAVYRELLKAYRPENIGMYGCSAGGALTAQSMAWFQREHLPFPGAIAMLCHGADRVLGGEEGTWGTWVRSDAAHIARALSGANQSAQPRYYRGVDRHTSVASPGDYDAVMAKFPPSLLISGTRDTQLALALVTHAQLVRLGVEAELHVLEGMHHCFHYNPAIPESREAYDVIVKFFDAHLGR